jgi:hypothetical protein
MKIASPIAKTHGIPKSCESAPNFDPQPYRCKHLKDKRIDVIMRGQEWYSGLSESQQDDVTAAGLLLMEQGPQLPFPYSSGINESKHAHMRELRVQSGGRPIRVFYAFDPRRTAILLIGGDKTGDERFYERMIPIADVLYDTYINEIRKEGLIP